MARYVIEANGEVKRLTPDGLKVVVDPELARQIKAKVSDAALKSSGVSVVSPMEEGDD